MYGLDLIKKDEKKENELRDRLMDCLKKHKMSWEDFLFFTNSNLSAKSVQAPMKENTYNEPSVCFYEDGSVWVSCSKGCVRLYNNCPIELMYQMFVQRYNEVNNDEK